MSNGEDVESRDPARAEAGVLAAGLLGSVATFVAASSCCLLPVLAAAAGIGGAWAATFEFLLPYHSGLLGVSLTAIGIGFWRVYRSGACARPAVRGFPVIPLRWQRGVLWAALLLAVASNWSLEMAQWI